MKLDFSLSEINVSMQAQVVGWVQDALGPKQVQALTDNVAAQLAALANPPVVTLPLPWDALAA